MELHELAVALVDFDWSYEFSDDHRAWERGVIRKAELLREANKTEDGRALYLAALLRKGV